MTSIRNPCVAGQFYPANPAVLQTMVSDLLQSAHLQRSDKSDPLLQSNNLLLPKAIIAPHAGYIYSGAIAASIYALLPQAVAAATEITNTAKLAKLAKVETANKGATLTLNHAITRVILLGPAHRHPVMGIAATAVDLFATPLGKIKIDKDAINAALTLPFVAINEHAYDGEHSLEVHLPFLQSVLANFTLAPFVVGNAKPEDIAQLIETLWGGPETLLVISSDLSHYYDYATAQKLDTATSQAILKLDPNAIRNEQACGRLPIKGLLLAAKNRNLTVKILDVRNSGDTAGAGDKNRVVGYGAYCFYEYIQ